MVDNLLQPGKGGHNSSHLEQLCQRFNDRVDITASFDKTYTVAKGHVYYGKSLRPVQNKDRERALISLDPADDILIDLVFYAAGEDVYDSWRLKHCLANFDLQSERISSKEVATLWCKVHQPTYLDYS